MVLHAVDEVARSAACGAGLLIADTSEDEDEDDADVADLMTGYGLMTQEIVDQLRASGVERAMHRFEQAGVSVLAAARAEGVRGQMAGDRCVIVVESDRAPRVAVALKAGYVQRVPGDLRTSAEMLSCGKASAPALKILLRNDAKVITVSEAELSNAVTTLSYHGGPITTPSGAAGLAGLITTLPRSPLARELGIDENSRVLLIATEGPVPVGDEVGPPLSSSSPPR